MQIKPNSADTTNNTEAQAAPKPTSNKQKVCVNYEIYNCNSNVEQ